MKKKIKNPFDWGNIIKNNKPFKLDIHEDEWDKFVPFILNKSLSMNPDLLDIINEGQEISDNHMLYDFYKEYIPPDRRWYTYQKSKKSKDLDELLNYLNSIFKLSNKEIKNYLKLLNKDQINDLLEKRGIEDKKRKKLLKLIK